MARIGSKNLLTYHDLLQRFIDHDQEIEFRQTEIATIKFPLKLAEVTQVDSKTSPAVQLADVMIGAAIEAGNNLAGYVPAAPIPRPYCRSIPTCPYGRDGLAGVPLRSGHCNVRYR
jgi:hypothetical protein